MIIVIALAVIVIIYIFLSVHESSHECPFDNGRHEYRVCAVCWSSAFGRFEISEMCVKCEDMPRIPFYNTANQKQMIDIFCDYFKITKTDALEIVKYIKRYYKDDTISIEAIRKIIENNFQTL